VKYETRFILGVGNVEDTGERTADVKLAMEAGSLENKN
jgi:hypothetical protein